MRLSRVIFLVMLMVGATSIHAQPCKYLVNKKDPITDDIIRTIKTSVTYPVPSYHFYYQRVGQNYTFKVETADFGQLTHKIPVNSELILRLEDRSTIKIYAKAEASPKSIKNFGEELTGYEVEYDISKEDMAKITQAGIIHIRELDFKNSFSDLPITSAVMDMSRKNAICVFED